jgi:hypothetical protein
VEHPNNLQNSFMMNLLSGRRLLSALVRGLIDKWLSGQNLRLLPRPQFLTAYIDNKNVR